MYLQQYLFHHKQPPTHKTSINTIKKSIGKEQANNKSQSPRQKQSQPTHKAINQASIINLID